MEWLTISTGVAFFIAMAVILVMYVKHDFALMEQKVDFKHETERLEDCVFDTETLLLTVAYGMELNDYSKERLAIIMAKHADYIPDELGKAPCSFAMKQLLEGHKRRLKAEKNKAKASQKDNK